MRRVYLYAPLPGPPDHMPYAHAAIALAEGLTRFGIEFYADRPYWRLRADRADTLFRFDKGVGPADCDLVLVDRHIFAYRHDIALDAVRQLAPRAILVLIDHTDFLRRAPEPPYDVFDIVLEAHGRVGGIRRPNRHPWPFARWRSTVFLLRTSCAAISWSSARSGPALAPSHGGSGSCAIASVTPPIPIRRAFSQDDASIPRSVMRCQVQLPCMSPPRILKTN